MRKSIFLYSLLIVFALFVVVVLVFQSPSIRNAASWRMDFALAYLRGLVDPVEPLPTALAETPAALAELPTLTPVFTRTPIPTPTPGATATPLPSPTPLPQSIALPAPKWEKQDINNCGPASLTMYLRFYGWEGVQTDVADVLKPYREDRNVNVEELVYYVRTRAGWLNTEYRVGGNLALLKQLLAAGIPVMVEESFYFEKASWANDDLWAAHYFLVTGYDDAAQMFTGQDSYHGADTKVSYADLDEYWQAFNRVYIMVYLPNQEGTLQAILGPDWDPDVNRQRALETAQSETQTSPDNAFAWFNLGSNLTYFDRYLEATDAYDKARELGLPQRMLRYQFGPFIAYFHSGQVDDLVTLTEYALKITPTSEEAWLWHGWAMYRKGKVTEAISDFYHALEENPNYEDAQYALDFVKSNP